MWGVGASAGPYIMGYVLSGGQHWSLGYKTVGTIQILVTLILIFSLPKWKTRQSSSESREESYQPLTLKQIVRIPGAKEIMAAFFGYCALEQTAMLWASSYLALYKGIPAETAAFFGSLCCVGITIGRALNGFLTMKFSDTQLIRLGESIILLGVAAMLLPLGDAISLAGLILVGLGCAPVYPCIIHSTPENFGAENSQALVGVQMASAYVGICLMPPLFGLIANHISISLLPYYLFGILALMAWMHERMLKKVAAHR
jgi:fucose permease